MIGPLFPLRFSNLQHPIPYKKRNLQEKVEVVKKLFIWQRGFEMLDISEINGVVCVKGTTDSSRGSMDIHVFLVDGQLIDTGPQSLLHKFIPFFESSDYDKVVLTHHHEDHSGGARWIQDHRDVPIFIHPLSVGLCAKDGAYPLYREMVWGKREGFQAKPLSSIFHSRTCKWEAIHIPDHAFDHMALLNHSTGTLFSGDLYVTSRPKMMLSFESVPVIMESIRKVLSYDFAEMYCSHAGFVQNGKDMLKQKLNYMENMSGEIIELYKQGLSCEEIKEKLMPTEYPLIQISDHEWDTLHFISSVVQYFEKGRK